MLLLICTRLFHNMQSQDYVLHSTPYKLLNWIQKDKLNYDNLSLNHKALHLLEQNQDKIEWMFLSENPNAIHFLEQNQDKIDWGFFQRNPNAMHLLEKNPDKIVLYYLWFELPCNMRLIFLKG